jgi:hypothetical protein
MRLWFAFALLVAGCRFEVASLSATDAAAPLELGPVAADLTSVDLTGFRLPPIRIDLNGPSIVGVDHPGTWAADPGVGGVCGPASGHRGNAVNGTVDDALFQGYMLGNPITCSVGMLLPGTYRVRLYFAEVYFGPGCAGGGPGTGARVFDIALEGTTVLRNFDIFAEGRCAMSTTDTTSMPVVKEFVVPVTDGTLDISLPASVNQALLSAIEILAD